MFLKSDYILVLTTYSGVRVGSKYYISGDYSILILGDFYDEKCRFILDFLLLLSSSGVYLVIG